MPSESSLTVGDHGLDEPGDSNDQTTTVWRGTFILRSDGRAESFEHLPGLEASAGPVPLGELFDLADDQVRAWGEAVAAGRPFSTTVSSPEGEGRWDLHGLPSPEEPTSHTVAVVEGRETDGRAKLEDSLRLLEFSPGLVCSHDLEGRLLYVNRAGAESLGYTPDDMVGSRLDSLLDSSVRDDFPAYLETLRQDGQAEGVMRIRNRWGETRLWAYVNRLVTDHGRDRVLGHAHDVTELYTARAEMRRLAQQDATTDLPNRRVFVRRLHAALEAAASRGTPLTLALINPVDFRGVNDRFGRPTGDQVLHEISQRLASFDGLEPYHFGGATFALIFPGQGESTLRMAEMLIEQLANGPYLDSSLRLQFSAGLAPHEPSDLDDPVVVEIQLIRRAGWALDQARDGSGVVVAGPSIDDDQPRRFLSGVFTTDLATDFRNMQLLWEVLDILGQQIAPEELAARLLDSLCRNLGFRRAGLEARTADGQTDWRVEEPSDAEESLWSPELVERAAAAEPARIEGQGPDGDLTWAVIPLQARERTLGVLVLETGSVSQQFRARLTVVEALADSIATALDRSILVRQKLLLQQYQSELLEQEVEDLRQVVQRSRMVSEAPAMSRLLERASRVSDSDVPVLVTGESGTGKEVFAQFFHDLGPRRSTEAVVIDLSTLSPSVIESELFGHRRGAFTGAEQDFPGRLAQSEGGTVILDEIGEFPVHLQPKLLRFVQTREVTAVGDHRPRQVDTRIIACTNRDLAAEVEAGRFRLDLFHRLNVLRFHLPPLRERREDIPALIEAFLHEFARQHGRRRTLTPEAHELTLAYSWPGNVRELKNRLLRAVLTSRGAEIGPDDLDLAIETSPPAVPSPGHLKSAGDGLLGSPSFLGADLPELMEMPSPVRSLPRRPKSAPVDDPWDALQRAVVGAIDAELEGPPPLEPLLQWLEHDLLRLALEAAGGAGNTAAQILDMAETTVRRRRPQVDQPPPPRPAYWIAVEASLERLLGRGGPGSRLHERVRHQFVERVASRLDDDSRSAARLAGVSPSTWRRWRRQADAG